MDGVVVRFSAETRLAVEEIGEVKRDEGLFCVTDQRCEGTFW